MPRAARAAHHAPRAPSRRRRTPSIGGAAARVDTPLGQQRDQSALLLERIGAHACGTDVPSASRWPARA
jgi:hypothetical protein